MKYKTTLSIGFLSKREGEIDTEDLGYEDEEWEALSEGEKEKVLDEALQEWIWEYIDVGVEPV